MGRNLVGPVVGMHVRWAGPSDCVPNEFFVENYLIPKYGTENMVVNSVEVYADGQPRVTLKINGIVPLEEICRSEPVSFHWDYFVPILLVEDNKEESSAVA